MKSERKENKDVKPPASRVIASAAEFEDRLQDFAREHALDCAGLVIVPQEGANAGKSTTIELARNLALVEFAHRVNMTLREKFETGDISRFDISDSTDTASVKTYYPITTFGTPIVVLWALQTPSMDIEAEATKFCNFVITDIENSKKSKFHDVLSENLKSFHGTNVYENIASSIRAGLFCERVVVWQLDDATLIAMTEDGVGLDLLVGDSIAGLAALRAENIVIPEFDKYEHRKLIRRTDWLVKHGINSGFFLPIFGPDGVTGVAGVFYRRRHGTTDVDLALCEYVVRYFERLWVLNSKNEELSKQLSRVSILDQHYVDIIKCLYALHDLPSIHEGAANALESLEILASSRDGAFETFIGRISTSLDMISDLFSPHERIIKLGKDNYRSLQEDGYLPNRRTHDLVALVKKEITIFENVFSVNRITHETKFSNIPMRMSLDSADVGTVLRNLIQNSCRALSSKSHVKRQVQVNISVRDNGGSRGMKAIDIRVWDNGIGIAPDDLPRIFEPEFTTYRTVGGRGLGLAIVEGIAKKYGTVPVVKTKWGDHCELTVTIVGQV